MYPVAQERCPVSRPLALFTAHSSMSLSMRLSHSPMLQRRYFAELARCRFQYRPYRWFDPPLFLVPSLVVHNYHRHDIHENYCSYCYYLLLVDLARATSCAVALEVVVGSSFSLLDALVACTVVICHLWFVLADLLGALTGYVAVLDKYLARFLALAGLCISSNFV